MKVSLQTRTGIKVRLQPAYFRTVQRHSGGTSSEAEAAPTVLVDGGLIEASTRAGGVPTTTALLTLPHSSIGVLYACSGGNLAVLLFDLGEPEVGTWLAQATRVGHLPLVLSAGGKAKVVHVPTDVDIDNLADRARASKPARVEDLTTAMQLALAQIDDGTQLAEWGVDVDRLTHGSVSLLTPAAFADDASTTVH